MNNFFKCAVFAFLSIFTAICLFPIWVTIFYMIGAGVFAFIFSVIGFIFSAVGGSTWIMNTADMLFFKKEAK